MRRLRRCVLLAWLTAVDPLLAGRTSAQFNVTATIVSSCRSIGVAGTWTRATLPADPARWVSVDCAGDTAYRVRATGPPVAVRRVDTPAVVRVSGGEPGGLFVVTVEF